MAPAVENTGHNFQQGTTMADKFKFSIDEQVKVPFLGELVTGTIIDRGTKEDHINWYCVRFTSDVQRWWSEEDITGAGARNKQGGAA